MKDEYRYGYPKKSASKEKSKYKDRPLTPRERYAPQAPQKRRFGPDPFTVADRSGDDAGDRKNRS